MKDLRFSVCECAGCGEYFTRGLLAKRKGTAGRDQCDYAIDKNCTECDTLFCGECLGGTDNE